MTLSAQSRRQPVSPRLKILQAFFAQTASDLTNSILFLEKRNSDQQGNVTVIHPLADSDLNKDSLTASGADVKAVNIYVKMLTESTKNMQVYLPATYSLENGIPITWDVTVIRLLADSYLNKVSLRVGQMNWLEVRKICWHSFRSLLQPIAFETLGALNSTAIDLLGFKVDQTGTTRVLVFFKRFSICFQRVERGRLNGTFPDCPALNYWSLYSHVFSIG